MSDIVEFLRARLDEDEQVARAAADAKGGAAWYVSRGGCGDIDIWVEQHLSEDDDDETEVSLHVRRHDPARVLREVAAKRRLMALHRVGTDPCDAHDGATMESEPCDVIGDLASVYSDHPDYDPAWGQA